MNRGFCGVWILDGSSPERLFSSFERAIGSVIGQGSYSGGALSVFFRQGQIRRERDCICAWEGFLAGDGPLREFFFERPPRLPPAGHYALVCADIARGRLRLFRDLSGGERLFYAVSGPALYFASSIRTLLRVSGISRELNLPVAGEFLLNGQVLFGSETLFSGVHEVPPGQMVTAADGKLTREIMPAAWVAPDVSGGRIHSPAEFRKNIREAVALAIGPDREAAVSLSGGVDSAAVAACAVELLGPQKVRAFTYEFADPSHESEVPPAAVTAKRLGIKHTALRITLNDFIGALPEVLWRTEDLPTISHPRPFILSALAAQAGVPKMLTGFGFEPLLGMLYDPEVERLSRAAEMGCLGRLLPPAWKLAFPNRRGAVTAARVLLGRVHPALKPPSIPLYYIAAAAFCREGIAAGVSDLFPGPLSALIRDESHIKNFLEPLAALPLGPLMQHLKYLDRGMVRPLHGMARLTAGAGSLQVSPAVFLHSSKLAGNFYQVSGGGRSMHIEAFRKELPPEITGRPKMQFQTSYSARWAGEVFAFIQKRFPGAERRILELFPGASGAGEYFRAGLAPHMFGGVSYLRPGNFLAFALWHRIWMENAISDAPPSWDDL